MRRTSTSPSRPTLTPSSSGSSSGSAGWRLHPSHFAERYGLVVIIALGEAFISIGIGATGIGIGLGEVVAAILGLLVAASFWLAYFDFFAIRGEQILRDLEGAERVALARDAYAYAHFPLIVGVVLFAFAMKDIVGHVGEELGENLVICPPDEMIERLAGYSEVGIDELVMSSNFGQPLEQTLEMMQRFAEQVLPHLGATNRHRGERI